MIAKRIKRVMHTSNFARLTRYVVDAQGQIDPQTWSRTADYILDVGNDGAKVGGLRITNCGADDPALAAIEVLAVQAKNTRSKGDKSYHLVFSFPAGEQPSLETLHAIEDELCAAIGLADHQRISAVHTDTAYLHVHVAINKVHPETYRNIEPYYDKSRLMAACDVLELRYGLQRTSHGIERDSRAPVEKEHSHDRVDDRHNRYGRGERDEHAIADQLRKSYAAALAERPKAESLDGLRTLSGVGVVRLARCGEVLLPGNAPGELVARGTERADPLRRTGNGDRGAEHGLTDGPADMEAHSGTQSLQGWIKRAVLPELEACRDWNALHTALAAHGLRLNARGAGMVISTDDGGPSIKASDAARWMSSGGLKKRFGPIEPASSAALSTPTIARYAAGPRQPHVSTAALFARYQRERDAATVSRNRARAALRESHAVYKARLAAYHVAKRQEIRGRRIPAAARKQAYSALAAERQSDWVARQAHEAQQRAEIVERHRCPVWQEWLMERAGQGDAEALAVLRSRERRQQLAVADILKAADARRAKAVVLANWKPRVDKSGAVHYEVGDGGRVADTREGVCVGQRTEAANVLAVLIAAEKYAGQPLIVDGSAAFRNDIARLAGARGLAVTFADAELEVVRANAAPAPAAVVVAMPADAPSAAAVLVAERNAQRARVGSILEHREWSAAEAGEAVYRGRRSLAGGGEAVLLERGGVMLVMPVTPAQAAKVGALRIGAAVRTDGRRRFLAAKREGPRR